MRELLRNGNKQPLPDRTAPGTHGLRQLPTLLQPISACLVLDPPPNSAAVAALPCCSTLQAAAAGRPAPVMVSQCALDYTADADFAGQLPVAAVPTFGRMVIPIAHSQPAPPAAGGGVLLHLWLPKEQAHELAMAAQTAAAQVAAATKEIASGL